MKITTEGQEFEIERSEVGGRYGYKVTINSIETMIYPTLKESDKIY